MAIAWETVTPVFTQRLRVPPKPPKPSDAAITMAQRSYDGHEQDGETLHVMRHRFKTVEEAEAAADELKRAGAYTSPETTVVVNSDPDETGDHRLIAWRAGVKRGRK